MKFICSKNELVVCLNSVTKTVGGKTTMPILEGIKIEAIEGFVKFITNDLEIGSEYILKAKVDVKGKIVVDNKMFNEIIRKIESETITFELVNNIFVIKSTSGIFKLATMNAEDYPELPLFNVENQIEVKQNILKEMIKKTSFAISTDENRPIYTGALVKVENNILTIVAIDGFRLALREHRLENSINDFKAIIPGKILSEIIRILSDEEVYKVKIGVNKNQILFEMDNLIIVGRIIEGEFLNYGAVIPSESTTKVRVNTKNILETLDRVALFSKEVSEKEKKAPIKIDIKLENIEVSCISQVGDAKEIINGVVEGKNLEIGFNPRYIMEAFKVIEDEEVIMNYTTSVSPMVIKPVAGSEYIYMVLPVKLIQE